MLITKELVASLCPVRPEDSHKGTFGMALICAGSKDMTGAQSLMAESSLRSGVGLVKVFSPIDSQSVTRVLCPCAIFESFGDTPSSVISAYNKNTKVTAVGIGPGIDEGDKRYHALLSEVIVKSPKLLIDAGALNVISKYKQEYLPLIAKRCESGLEPAVLTPHVGEFKRLCEGETTDLDEACVQFALQNKCVTVLKKHKTIISTPDGERYNNSVGNSGLAKGGSGDVLSGLITGFMAQGMSSIDAAVSGVYIHGLTGDIMAEEMGKRVMLPSDMPGFLTEAFEEVDW